jgi:hypothetical protein
LNPGQEVTAIFNFKRPTKDPLFVIQILIIKASISSLNDIGMWVATKVELKLSGGFVPVGVTDAITVELILKAYVEQI